MHPFSSNVNVASAAYQTELALVNSSFKKYDKLQTSILNKSFKFLKELEKNAHKRLLCVCFQALGALASNNEEARRCISDNTEFIGKLVESIQLNIEVNNVENISNTNFSNDNANMKTNSNKKLIRTIFYDITDNENNVKVSAKNGVSEDDEEDDEEDEEEEDEDEDENIEDNTESSSFEAYFSSCEGHNEIEMNQETSKEININGGHFIHIERY